MLSILIPSYNYNIVELVKTLHQQATDSFVDFEIRVIEDGSTKFLEENNSIASLSNCYYEVLKHNIGRSAIRNLLADKAKYDYLLFLDCDAAITNDYFINKYLSFCHETAVVLGGRIYEEKILPEYSLTSFYGREREENNKTNISRREKRKVFTSPNFLIPKSVFNQVRFDENIKGYGHEDTIFGLMLKQKNIKFNYIDNPVVHVGLDTNEVFIKKTEHALKNLYNLYKNNNFPQLKEESKILSFYLTLNKYKLDKTVLIMFNLLKSKIYKQIISPKPSLFLFDLYKLGILCNIATNNDNMSV